MTSIQLRTVLFVGSRLLLFAVELENYLKVNIQYKLVFFYFILNNNHGIYRRLKSISSASFLTLDSWLLFVCKENLYACVNVNVNMKFSLCCLLRLKE